MIGNEKMFQNITFMQASRKKSNTISAPKHLTDYKVCPTNGKVTYIFIQHTTKWIQTSIGMTGRIETTGVTKEDYLGCNHLQKLFLFRHARKRSFPVGKSI